MMEESTERHQQMIAALNDIYQVFDDVPFAVAALKGPDLIIDYINDYNLAIWQKKRGEVLGKPLFDVKPDVASAASIHREVYATGLRFRQDNVPFVLNNNGVLETRYFNVVIDPIRSPEGIIVGQMATSVEVTAQVRARQEAEERESYFRNIANAVPTIIWMSDKAGNCIYLNDRWYHVTGQSIDASSGFGWAQAVHTDDQHMAANHFLAANLQQISFKMIFRLLQKNGSYRWVMGSGEPRWNANGQFEGYAGSVIDIHEQVQANERFQLINKATQDAIWDWDLVTNSVIWNNAFYLMFGYGSEEVELNGDWWVAHIHHGDRERIAAGIHAAIDSGATVWTGEYRFLTREGASKTVYDRGFILHDSQGKPIRMLGSMQDITARKMTEEALRYSEEKYRQQFDELENIYRNAPIGLALISKDSHYLRVNDRLAAMNGLSVHEHVNRHFRDVIPGHAAQGEALVKQVVESKQALMNVIVTGETPADPGVIHIWNESWYPVLNPEGEVESVSVVVEDITARRKAEDDLKESENRFRLLADSLELQVAGRTRELHRSNQDLQQFAHVASHDLKEPVRKILIFSNRIKEEMPALSLERLLNFVSKIESAANRMYAMINGVLLYSTVNATEQETERINLNLVLQGIASDLEVSIAGKQGQIVYNNLPCVEGAGVLIYQLFYNLISNSLKFSKEGVAPYIQLTHADVLPEERKVHHLDADRPFVKIIITDNGIGFRATDNNDIFEAFRRLHPKDRYEGSGLGLSLCKKIVERHGGAIWASALEGQGAVFTVVLPA